MNSAAVESTVTETYPTQLVTYPSSGGSMVGRICFHLLWKESRQLAFFLGFSLIIISAIQIMVLALIWIDRVQFLDSARIIYDAAFFSPFVFLLGVVAVSISIERDSGAWLWSSTFPVHWSMGLLSKIVVGLAGSALCLVCSLGVAAVLLPMLALTPGKLEAMQFWPALGPIVLTVLQGLPILCISVLLFREPANGLILGAIAVLVVEVVRVNLFYFETWIPLNTLTTEAGWAIVSKNFLIVILTLSAGWLYRWRCRLGMFSEVTSVSSWRIFGGAETTGTLSLIRQNAGVYPTLRWLSFQQNYIYLGILLLVVAAACCLPAFGFRRRMLPDVAGGVREVVAWVSLFSVLALLGLFGFAGDQTKNRYLFLAERGVSPAAIWWGRFLYSVALPTLIVLLAGFVFSWSHDASNIFGHRDVIFVLAQCGWILGLLSVSFLVGLTIRSWFLACFAVVLFFIMMTPFIILQVEGSGLWGGGFALSLPILALPLSYYLVPKWLTYYRAQLTGYFCVFFLVLVAANLAAYPFLRVYVIPGVKTDLGTPLPLPISGFTNLREIPFDLPNLTGLAAEVKFESQQADADSLGFNGLEYFTTRSLSHEYIVQAIEPFTAEENQRLQDLLNLRSKSTLESIESAFVGAELPVSQLTSTDLLRLSRCQYYLGNLALLAVASGDYDLAKRAFDSMNAMYERNPGLWALSYDIPSNELRGCGPLLDLSAQQWEPFLEEYGVDVVCPDRSSQKQMTRQIIRGLSSYFYREGKKGGEFDSILDTILIEASTLSYSFFPHEGSNSLPWEVIRRQREAAYLQKMVDDNADVQNTLDSIAYRGLPAVNYLPCGLNECVKLNDNFRAKLRIKLLEYQARIGMVKDQASDALKGDVE